MRKNLLIISVLLAVALVATGCATSQLPASESATKSMNVSGLGTVFVEPDVAYINIGVQSRNSEANLALEENNANANAIRNALLDLGVEDKDIQTSNFNIYRQQTQPMTPEEEAENIFVVENTVSVAVRQLDSLGEVLSAVVRQGANTIYGITFSIEDSSTAIKQARELALENAKAEAQAIADAAGVKLGKITSLNINESATPMAREAAVETAQGLGGSVPVSAGSLSVQVTVYVTYEFD